MDRLIIDKKIFDFRKDDKMRILIIIAQKLFRDEELDIPKRLFEANGIKVDVASVTTEIAVGKLGMQVNPDLSFKDAKSDDYDAIMIVGGPGAPELKNYPEVLNLIKEFDKKQKLVTAICIAPTILAKAGILKGKKATVFPTGADELKMASAIYTGDHVTVDGRIITGDGPESAKIFAEKVIERLNIAFNT